ncbi:hypothetical protein PIB30_003346 [Stylosanthes scabra]|uniref:Uncharacterized protein n=1 Tax=Stylosanthes scabra TaxID=79078 RepID=A0ABU6T4Z2_9FABA|nr:hypothetical protein [Stylosanthes scabra]
MATRHALFRSSSSSSSSFSFTAIVRSFATASHHNNHRQNHKFLDSNTFLGSWQPPKDPKEAEAKLAMLRREYAKQVKEVRKQYIHEMELLQIEKQRKDEARREALRVANEERKKLKAEAAQIRAQERKIAQQEFRETLLRERAEKLENWRMKVKKHGDKMAEKKNSLHKQSSMWIDEANLEQRILDAMTSQGGFYPR